MKQEWILPTDFVDRSGRRVLTDDGKPGMDGKAWTGSQAEMVKAEMAALIFKYGGGFNNEDIEDLENWITLVRKRSGCEK